MSAGLSASPGRPHGGPGARRVRDGTESGGAGGEGADGQRQLHAAGASCVHIEIADTVRIRASGDVITVLLGNLVANAFQHASGGRVRIVGLEDGRLRVDGDGPGFPDLRAAGGGAGGRNDLPAKPGFGIGLELSERLCRTPGPEAGPGRLRDGWGAGGGRFRGPAAGDRVIALGGSGAEAIRPSVAQRAGQGAIVSR